MITSKQRVYLRGLANGIDALYQIGKEGITENMLTQFDNALEARELIKITILKNAFLDPRTTLSDLAKSLEAEPVSAVGLKIVLYRESKKNKQIILPKK
ncbi:ribosome assembly RNA-binding protein YhbY [Acetivibrio sp. MSJd-27]|uniref:ribosome assembly RNA-binding protein YhbY n=1 Tax=Acetivibrio sp. MSJd-27 TaxID=2841523 RepID=UPI001C111DDF|nr:ribosome assembly RNA-binding protein YhbY [Acetivibrio sp. MSJd-27]MBU5449722.1 ribosome assembly RNA-binding protein YhbY [Acetivibrio sp. MSJd-27]